MKNKFFKIILLVVLILIIIVCFIINNLSKEEEKQTEEMDTENEYSSFMNNSIMYKENATLKELKEEYNITGPDEIYEIQTEYDGRKAIVVKEDINYKVAFAGMIKNSIPDFSEIDSLFEEKYPKNQNGVWIEETNREIILNYLNNSELLKNEYSINENGFLKMQENDDETNLDKELKDILNSQNTYIISVSGICYMVDPVTGEIVKNPFEDLDHGQTYEYFENENDKIVFITENINKELTNDEILKSVISLIIE